MDCREISGYYDHKWYKFDEKRMVILFENEDEEKVEIPAKYEVCSLCGGKGSHVNPSIDSNGITGEEWNQWDHEDREDYLNGVYDVPCNTCNGKRVEPVPDKDFADPQDLKDWESSEESHYEDAKERYRENYYGY